MGILWEIWKKQQEDQQANRDAAGRSRKAAGAGRACGEGA